VRAVYALNGRPHGRRLAHLVLADGGRALCGVLPGEPAPAVTCQGCASKWAYQTREGRSAMHRARLRLPFTLLADALRAQDGGTP
jgi:hypothetical protein